MSTPAAPPLGMGPPPPPQEKGGKYEYSAPPPRPRTGFRTKLSLKGLKKQLGGFVKGRPSTVGNSTGQIYRDEIKKVNPPKKEKTYGAYGAPLVEKPGLIGAAERWTQWYKSAKPGTASKTRLRKNQAKKGPFHLGNSSPYESKATVGPDRTNSGYSENYDVYRPLTGTTDVRRPMTSGMGLIQNQQPFSPAAKATYTVQRPLSGTADSVYSGQFYRPLTGTTDYIDIYDDGRPSTGFSDQLYARPFTAFSRPLTGDSMRENTPEPFELFDPSMRPSITPYPQRPLTKQERGKQGLTKEQKSLQDKMGASDPWLIDIHKTLPLPKGAAPQSAPGTPNKRALINRPGTAVLPALPRQSPVKTAPYNKSKIDFDVKAMLKAATKKRPNTVAHDSRVGHSIKYTDSVTELGSHSHARETIENQAHLQREQAIRDFESWEKDLVDLKWAKDSVKGWGTLGSDIMKNKIQRLNEREHKKRSGRTTHLGQHDTNAERFRRAFHKSLGNGGEVEMLWCDIPEVPRSFITTLSFQVAGLRVLRLTGNKITHFADWFTRSFPHLTELHVGSNNLSRLPENIGLLTSLEELYLPHNSLTELPWDIGKLTRLEIIDLTNNKLNRLPNSIGKLTCLDTFLLEHNNLIRVPDTSKDMLHVREFRLGFNPIATMALVHIARPPPPPPTHDEVRLYEPIILGDGECIGYKHVDTGEVIARLPEIPTEDELRDEYLNPYQLLVKEQRPIWEIQFDNRNGKSFYFNNLTYERASCMPKKIDLLGNMRNLEFLSLQNVLLRDIPESIGDCILLREVLLQNNKIEILPYTICNLVKLELLSVSNNYIHHLPKYMHKMTSLRTLKVDRNRLNNIPESLGRMVKIERLWLQNNKIMELPSTMMYLSNLTDLMLDGNPCEETLRYLFEKGGIPAYQYSLKEVQWREKHGGRPPNVEISTRGLDNEVHIPEPRFNLEFDEVLAKASLSGHLDLQWRSFSSLSSEILSLTSLTSLRMNNNNFTSIPDDVANIKTLVTLHIANNKLTSINPKLCSLKKLKHLYAEDNEIVELPDKIQFMIRLKELRVCRNKLSALPEKIGKCVGLERLELQVNRLRKLPQSITNCYNLKRLNLQKNSIRKFPVSFDRLTSLEHLDLNQNRIKTLPLELATMVSLKDLLLSSNRVEYIDESFGQGNLRSTLQKLWLHANRFVQLPLSFQHLTKLNELKLGWNRQLISPPFELAIDVTGELNLAVNKKIQMCSWWWTEERIKNLKNAPRRPRFKPGESGWSVYHEGTISKVNTDDTYDIVFDDCARAGSVERHYLRLLSHGIPPRKAFQKDNLDSNMVEVASGTGGNRAGRFDGEVHIEQLNRIDITDPPGKGIFVGDRIVAKKPKLLAPIGFGVDSVREYCAVREWRLEDFRQAMKSRNVEFAHSRLTPKAHNLLVDPLILSYLDQADVSDIDTMADGYVNGPFSAGSNSANVVQEMLDLIELRKQQFHHKVLSALLSVIDRRRAEVKQMPWGANGALIKSLVIRPCEFVGLPPEEYIAEFTLPGSVGVKLKSKPGGGGLGAVVQFTTGQAADYMDGKIKENHLLLKIGRGQNVSGEQLWGDAESMSLMQIEKLVGRMKCPSKLWFRATLAMPYTLEQVLRAIEEYEGPYGKVAEIMTEKRRPFDGQGDKIDEADPEASKIVDETDPMTKEFLENHLDCRQKEVKKRKKKKKEKVTKERATGGWVTIQSVIYSPLEARKLAAEFKYTTETLSKLEAGIDQYLKSFAGKIKLHKEVIDRMKQKDESSSKVEKFYSEAAKKFAKAESKYEDMKTRVSHFENGGSYNTHKFRSKDAAYKKLNIARDVFEKEQDSFRKVENANRIVLEQQSWTKSVWYKHTREDLFTKYKFQKSFNLRKRFRTNAEKKGERRPWDDGFENWKHRRLLKKEKKAYEVKLAKLAAKRAGVQYVNLNADDDSDQWSEEEEKEAQGELEHLQLKAKKAMAAKLGFFSNLVENGIKAVTDAAKKKYNSLNAYSWDKFDPLVHCQGPWDGILPKDEEEEEIKEGEEKEN